MDTNQKREKEKEMLRLMIRVYCRGKHKSKKGLCPQCQELQEYAWMRTEKCPFMETKTFCSACKVHCYAPEMRDKVREVMKYAGSRMLFYHPTVAIRHMGVTIQNKKKLRKEGK